MTRIPVGVLGATGTVGQKFILLLDSHPWFEIKALAASDRSAGLPYSEAVSWKQRKDIPKQVRDLEVLSCEANLGCSIVFSGLSSSVAGTVEEHYARQGCWVFSNAKNFRMEPDVPLMIAELNPDHLSMVARQREERGWSGAIVTNPNCSTIVLALALGPLYKDFGLESVHVTTLQALSGAGYPGVASLDSLANVVPLIKGEEEKIETETLKILGGCEGHRFEPAEFGVSAHTNRVPVEDGHMACVSLSFREKPDLESIKQSWSQFRAEPQTEGLPSAPETPIVYMDQEDRPQPRLDVEKYGGMSVLVGRLRHCNILDYRFVALGHNTIRGAAGASVLNAELAVQRGLID